VYDGVLPPRQRSQSTAERAAAPPLHAFATRYAADLQLDPDLPTQVAGFHPSFHVDENGQLVAELVAQWTQKPPKNHPSSVGAGGVELRAGTTAVFGADGRVRYVATRPLPGPHLRDESHRELAELRVAGFRSYVDALDADDALAAWSDSGYDGRRMESRASFAAAHRGRRSWRRSGA
jgi:hypothetical protein